jgi:phytanoyl-CoA hydroxylase
VAPVAHAINKIAHGLHDEVSVFDCFSHDLRLATLCATLGINTPRLVQSMYIFKQPRIGGEVVWHQDSTFLYTEPMSVIGLWVALQPATRANGCFWVLPGAHLGCIARRVTALECA